MREAEASYRKLTDKSRSLSVYLDYALANYREPEREVLAGADLFNSCAVVALECSGEAR